MAPTTPHSHSTEDYDGVELKAEKTETSQPAAILHRHGRSHIPLEQFLRAVDNILLFTPVVAIDGDVTHRRQDPFKPLSRSIAYRHAGVRHVPYTARNGITSTHVGFIKTAGAVVFVVSGRPDPEQLDLAREVQQYCRSTPLVLIVPKTAVEGSDDFSTVLQVPNFTQESLRSVGRCCSRKGVEFGSVATRSQLRFK